MMIIILIHSSSLNKYTQRFLHRCLIFKVRVDLTAVDNVCSVASRIGRYRQEVKIGPQTTRSVPFIIIPMKEGEHLIEVKAAVRDSYLSDGVKKTLRVVVRDSGNKQRSPVLVNVGKLTSSGATVLRISLFEMNSKKERKHNKKDTFFMRYCILWHTSR